jgi:hypothetical protein
MRTSATLAALASLLLLTSVAGARGLSINKKLRGIKRMDNWTQSYRGIAGNTAATYKAMRSAINGIVANRKLLSSRAWRTFQIRAAKIDGAAEASTKVLPITRQTAKGPQTVGGKLVLESVIGTGRKMSVAVSKQGAGFRAQLDNGLGTQTTLVLGRDRASSRMNTRRVAPQPLHGRFNQ